MLDHPKRWIGDRIYLSMGTLLWSALDMHCSESFPNSIDSPYSEGIRHSCNRDLCCHSQISPLSSALDYLLDLWYCQSLYHALWSWKQRNLIVNIICSYEFPRISHNVHLSEWPTYHVCHPKLHELAKDCLKTLGNR